MKRHVCIDMFASINPPTGPNWKLRSVATLAVVALGAGVVSLWRAVEMPLRPYRGDLPPLSAAQMELSNRLHEHVSYLSATIRERNSRFEGAFPQTIDYLRNQLGQMDIQPSSRRIRSMGSR